MPSTAATPDAAPMLSFNALVFVCGAYVAVLFAVAFAADREARRGRARWLRSSTVYTLSLSVYCTAWTFYGAVGYAARSGLEFVTIYLGPTLVMLAWWSLLRKLVRIGRTQRTTSIADLISARFGKSAWLAGLVTVLAVIGTTPYIALQLQSVTLSFAAFSPATSTPNLSSLAFLVAAGLAVFTIIFGTRSLDANERHHGVVTAIAVEAVVKLIALMAVGVFVIWGVAGGLDAIVDAIEAAPISGWEVKPGRWSALIFLSAAAFLCLPRMFQVMVVENTDERHLATAAWAFPAYLLLMSLFVVPIAVVGLAVMPEGSNPDLFVLTVPLQFEADGLATLAFLGGFSSATSMVIVAAIALSTMVSNHVVMPIWLNARSGGATVSGDVRDVVLMSRRLSIAAILILGWLYYRLSGGGTALATIGLISFTGVSQVLPSLIGGIFWRGATRAGAGAGVLTGLVVWLWTLFLPSFGETALLTASVMTEGPFGIAALRPQALFGTSGLDPLVHAVFWSLLLNTSAFLVFSLLSFPGPLERLQGAAFVDIFRVTTAPQGWSGRGAEAEDLLLMTQRILGPAEAQRFFREEAESQAKAGYLPDVTSDLLERLERRLAGSVGAATAHAMIAQITGGSTVSVEDLMRVADEAQQILEYSNRLEAKSTELQRTARQLREANAKLTALSAQKDAFLSQVSHELRTPMTSIRAFSEILMDSDSVPEADRLRMSSIIHTEAVRLTRLLDDLLDLSVLENGQVTLNMEPARLSDIIDRAVDASGDRGDMTIARDRAAEDIWLDTDGDRLAQVFINLVSNARKYCDAKAPHLTISVRSVGDVTQIDVGDNGTGIPKDKRRTIFEKFTRAAGDDGPGGVGLGLAICQEIMRRLGGSIACLDTPTGATFRLTLPARARAAAE